MLAAWRPTRRTTAQRLRSDAAAVEPVRVVAGSARGLRIGAPEGHRVRPTTDRVREATFNALGSMGMVDGRSFADLFAGSGALGIEALSRGAAGCTFCESDRSVARLLRSNLERTRLEGRARVLVGDVMAHLGEGGSLGNLAVDVALADPPYDFDRWDELLEHMTTRVLVAESDRDLPAPRGWSRARQRRYGGTVVTILEASSL